MGETFDYFFMQELNLCVDSSEGFTEFELRAIFLRGLNFYNFLVPDFWSRISLYICALVTRAYIKYKFVPENKGSNTNKKILPRFEGTEN